MGRLCLLLLVALLAAGPMLLTAREDKPAKDELRLNVALAHERRHRVGQDGRLEGGEDGRSSSATCGTITGASRRRPASANWPGR